jgi:ABC-type transporter Mla subunit MlaD
MIEVRDHLSGRITKARLQLELRRSVRPALVVLLGALVALAGAVYIASRVSRTLLTSTYEMRVAVNDATAVVPGINDVRFRGVPAGTITDVDAIGTQPVLTVKLQKKYGKIYRDARAALRPNTALQDMYLDVLDRGTPAAGQVEGDTPLSANQVDTAVSINDVLAVFNADTRTRLRTLLDELGNGLEDRGARLRTAFVELAPLLEVAGSISKQVAERRPLAKRLVHNTAVLTTELGRRDRELRRLVRDGSTTLSTLQSGARDLDATLLQLPRTLESTDASFTAVRGVLGDVDAAVRTLRPVARQLPGSLTALRRLAATAAPAVRALKRPIGELVPLAKAIVPVSADLSRAVGVLNPQIDTVDHLTKQLVNCKKGLQGFFQWDASMSKFGDTRGPVPRGNVVFGLQSSGVISDPNEYAPQACTPGQPIGGRLPTRKDEH